MERPLTKKYLGKLLFYYVTLAFTLNRTPMGGGGQANSARKLR